MEKSKIVKIHTEYITLQQLLKLTDFISNGGEAKIFLASNIVFVNSESETRRGRKLYPGYVIKVNGNQVLIEDENNKS